MCWYEQWRRRKKCFWKTVSFFLDFIHFIINFVIQHYPFFVFISVINCSNQQNILKNFSSITHWVIDYSSFKFWVVFLRIFFLHCELLEFSPYMMPYQQSIWEEIYLHLYEIHQKMIMKNWNAWEDFHNMQHRWTNLNIYNTPRLDAWNLLDLVFRSCFYYQF